MMNLTAPMFLSALFPAALLCSLLSRYFWGEKAGKAVLLPAGLVFVYLSDGISAWLPALLVIFTCVFTAVGTRGNALPAKIWGIFCCLLFLGFRIFGISGTTGFAFLVVEIVICCFEPMKDESENPVPYGCGSRMLDTALCLTFLPSYQSGPVRKPELFKNQEKVTADALLEGLMRICAGLGKKMLIAENIYRLSSAGTVSGSAAGNLTALIFSGIYVYFDFSGYTDMALGLGRCFGFRLPENFHDPFRAVSVRDFWKRWHITLSSFLRDYVYIPLGGNRKGKTRACLHTLVVFGVTVLWHGLAVPYICFGLWHAFFVILEQRKLLQPEKWKPVFRHLYTLAVVLMGFLFFTAPDAAGIFRCLLPDSLVGPAFLAALSPLAVMAAGAAVLLIVFASRLHRLPRGLRWFLCGIILLLSLLHRAGAGYLPFLYGTF